MQYVFSLIVQLSVFPYLQYLTPDSVMSEIADNNVAAAELCAQLPTTKKQEKPTRQVPTLPTSRTPNSTHKEEVAAEQPFEPIDPADYHHLATYHHKMRSSLFMLQILSGILFYLLGERLLLM